MPVGGTRVEPKHHSGWNHDYTGDHKHREAHEHRVEGRGPLFGSEWEVKCDEALSGHEDEKPLGIRLGGYKPHGPQLASHGVQLVPIEIRESGSKKVEPITYK